MKKLLWAVVVLLLSVAAAYLAGRWPESERRAGAESELLAVRAELGSAQARLRLSDLFGKLLALTDAFEQRNYGVAEGLSRGYFEGVQAERQRATDPGLRAALDGIAAQRDALTAALVSGDPRGGEVLRGLQQRMRGPLGYPAAPGSPAPATPSPEPPGPSASPLP